MASSATLRVDWYSLLLGTQVSASTGILTATSYSINHLRFPREFIQPSVFGRNTLFLQRIKQDGNCLHTLAKLFCRLLEKHILGGSIYIFFDEAIGREKSTRTKAFIYGGLLGLSFNFRYNWHSNFAESIASALSAAELTLSGEEVRKLILEDSILKPEEFKMLISYDKASFLAGALTGCIHGIFFSNFGTSEWLDDIPLPDDEEVESRVDFCIKYSQVAFDLTGRIMKVVLFYVERYLVGGVMFCVFEKLIAKATGWSPSRVVPPAAILLGLYFGIDSVHFGNSWKYLSSTAFVSRMFISLLYIIKNSLQ